MYPSTLRTSTILSYHAGYSSANVQLSTHTSFLSQHGQFASPSSHFLSRSISLAAVVFPKHDKWLFLAVRFTRLHVSLLFCRLMVNHTLETDAPQEGHRSTTRYMAGPASHQCGVTSRRAIHRPACALVANTNILFSSSPRFILSPS